MLCSEYVEDRHHRFSSGVPFLASLRDDLQTAIECPSMFPRYGCARCRCQGSPSSGQLPKVQFR
jgi:hypothetical protein